MTSSFLDKPAPDYGPDLLNQIKLRCPNVFFIFFRNKNQNIVVFELNIQNNQISSKKPIDWYWLDIDPAYRAPRRAQGIMHDRVEMSAFDQTAFGITSEIKSPTEVIMNFNVQPHPMRVIWNDKGARMFVIYDHVLYMVRSASVIGTTGLPDLINLRSNVKELSFSGIDMESKPQKLVKIVVMKN
jgi:hypothetical protein